MLEIREILNLKIGKKGFTLAELLVVVAILAVLVAVSIPIFTGRLEKAKEATDAANMRAAKVVLANETLSASEKGDVGGRSRSFFYDNESGKLFPYYDDIEGPIWLKKEKVKGYNKLEFSYGGKTIAAGDGVIIAWYGFNLGESNPDISLQWIPISALSIYMKD